jgi:TRAP-type mannitol/chloroaromatic compound transport system substrate-binding protein
VIRSTKAKAENYLPLPSSLGPKKVKSLRKGVKMAKRIVIGVVVVILLASSVLAACAAPTPTPTPTPAPTPTPTPTPTPAPAPSPAEPEKFEWQMQAFVSPVDAGYQKLVEYWAMVKEETDGRLDVTMFPAEAIVPTSEIPDALMKGVVELGYTCLHYYIDRFPASAFAYSQPSFKLNLYSAFYLHYGYGLGNLLAEDVLAKTDGKVRYHGFYLNSCMFFSNKKLESMADFKGAKVRATGIAGEWINRMGGNATYVIGSDFYLAMETGLLDAGYWASYQQGERMKFQEVSKYFVEPAWGSGMSTSVLMSTAALETLPDDLKAYFGERLLLYTFEANNFGEWTDQVRGRKVWVDECTRCYIPLEEQEKMNEVGRELLKDHVAEVNDAATSEAYEMYLEFMEGSEYLGWID